MITSVKDGHTFESDTIELEDGRIIIEYTMNMTTGELVDYCAYDWHGEEALHKWKEIDFYDAICTSTMDFYGKDRVTKWNEEVRTYLETDPIEGQYVRELMSKHTKLSDGWRSVERYLFELASKEDHPLYQVDMRVVYPNRVIKNVIAKGA